MRILFLTDGTVSSVLRQELPAKALNRLQKEETYIANISRVNKKDLEGYHMYCFIRPTYGVDQIIAYIKVSNPNAYIIVDQDDCFDLIPKHHVAYNNLGKGNPHQMDATKRAMDAADLVIVSTKQLQEYYSEFNPIIVPNGWSKHDRGWSQDIKKDHFVLGWAGTITHREDFKLMRNSILQILEEFPEVKIVIGNDEVIYNSLDKIPEDQKLFVPMLGYQKYIYLLKSFDLFLVPLVNDKFNQYKSDIKLVDAGAANIPYVASSIENYCNWKVGGIITNDYYGAIKNYILDPDLRNKDRELGNKSAQEREIDIISKQWKQFITNCANKIWR